jgi:hypothetical protein
MADYYTESPKSGLGNVNRIVSVQYPIDIRLHCAVHLSQSDRHVPPTWVGSMSATCVFRLCYGLTPNSPCKYIYSPQPIRWPWSVLAHASQNPYFSICDRARKADDLNLSRLYLRNVRVSVRLQSGRRKARTTVTPFLCSHQISRSSPSDLTLSFAGHGLFGMMLFCNQ